MQLPPDVNRRQACVSVVAGTMTDLCRPSDRSDAQQQVSSPIAIRGVCSMATRGLLDELVTTYLRHAAVRVSFQPMGGVDALKRVLSGEHFDMVALASNAIDQLVAAGKANGSARIDFVRSGVGVAVRAGAAHPVIDTQDALRDTVLRASGIGYSTGPSGVALLALFVRWNVLDQIRDRLLQASPGTPVGALVANGEVTLGFQQESELIGVAGIELLGPMPPGTEIVTIFSAAPVLGGSHSETVNAFLDFINSNANDEIKRRFGLMPM